MPPALKSVFTFLSGPPLHYFWYLLGGLIIGGYALAHLFYAIPGETIVHKCRRAWGMAFLVHGVITLGFMLKWYFGHRLLTGLTSYLPFYVVLFLVDLMVGIGLILAARRFQTYQTT